MRWPDWMRCGACAFHRDGKRHHSWRIAWCACTRFRWHRGPCRFEREGAGA